MQQSISKRKTQRDRKDIRGVTEVTLQTRKDQRRDVRESGWKESGSRIPKAIRGAEQFMRKNPEANAMAEGRP